MHKYHSLSHQITPDTTIYNILPYCDLFVWVTLLPNVILGHSGTSLLIVFCVIAGLVFISNLDKMSKPGYGKRPRYVSKYRNQTNSRSATYQYDPCSSIETIISICIKEYYSLESRCYGAPKGTFSILILGF